MPVRCGVSVEEAGLALLARLEQDQIDLDSCTDLVILERPLAVFGLLRPQPLLRLEPREPAFLVGHRENHPSAAISRA